jgi:hypothetical protein
MSDIFKLECPKCGQRIECPAQFLNQIIACPGCQDQIIACPSSPAPTQPDFTLPPGFSAKETTVGPYTESASGGLDFCLFQEAGVTVTKSVIVVGGETFPVGAITSVKGLETGRFGGLLKSDFSVVLTTSAGEVSALTSRDKLLISKVIEAIRLALVLRG